MEGGLLDGSGVHFSRETLCRQAGKHATSRGNGTEDRVCAGIVWLVLAGLGMGVALLIGVLIRMLLA